ncbi:MAG: F0F1 ATP synthase subunit gamma [Firmicutes bacterium]|nr:F0F1 ATP synthase subunit gamma [Bacillota bacterium]
MSNNLETLQKQIKSGEDLASIVKTMKALAATSVQQYEKAVESLDDYYETVEMGLSVVLTSKEEQVQARRQDQHSPILLVIFGSDHGLAGHFNEQIVHFALEEYWQEEGREFPQNRYIACVGEQVFTRVTAAGHHVAEHFGVPVSTAGITVAVQTLLARIEGWRDRDGVQQVLLLYNRPLAGATFASRVETLLPVDLSSLRKQRVEWQSRSLPTYTIPAPQLLSELLRQYFFVSLYRAFAFSLAAENASRLAAMQAAEKNIDERLEELTMHYQQERQTAITEEILDIISGFKALRRKNEGIETIPQ